MVEAGFNEEVIRNSDSKNSGDAILFSGHILAISFDCSELFEHPGLEAEVVLVVPPADFERLGFELVALERAAETLLVEAKHRRGPGLHRTNY